ncbi:helix-turn-helix domain-containing protein [Candidatus Parcubacteria bacterium]|nr:helix-turn-helix domain-containing protein [Candidatus Parcubacteria bacterium]
MHELSGEIPNNSQWLEENRGHFIEADELASQIGDQNQLYSELVESGQVTIEPFREATTDYLTAEQGRTFQELAEAQAAAPYEQLADRERRLSAALGEVTAKLSSIEQQQQEEAASIHKEEELVAGRIPDLASRLSEIASRLENQMPNAAFEVKVEKTILEDEYEAVADVYKVAGKAWPIPRLISTKQPEQITEITEPESPDDLIEIDDFPEESDTLTKEEIAEKVRREYPEEVLSDASEYVGLLLAEEPGHIFTAEDLAEILYGKDETRGRSRINALISNYRLGKVDIIGETLYDKGLVFQHGERRSYNKTTGKPFGRHYPVFRAVPAEQPERNERVIHSDELAEWVNDDWHTIILDSFQTAEATESTGIALEIPRGPNEDMGESITQTMQIEPPIERRQKERPEWEISFETAIQDVIASFEADGLMIEGEVSRSLIRVKSSAGTMGTETMAARAVANKIISKGEVGNESKIPIYKYICMALQNTHSEIFTDRSKRKQAMAIAERSVNQYFEAAKTKKQ